MDTAPNNTPEPIPLPSPDEVRVASAYLLGGRHLEQLRQLEAAHCRTVKANRVKLAQLAAARTFVQETYGDDAAKLLDALLWHVHRAYYPKKLPKAQDVLRQDFARTGRTSCAAPNPSNVRPRGE